MLKVALVGIGGINKTHRNCWAEIAEAQVVAACDIRDEKLQLAVEQFGCKGYHDFDEMLDREQIDILDICLPTYLHADFAVKALEKGIHVITEKPISLKLADVRRVYDAARRNNCRFMVAHVIRFWREYEAVAQAYRSSIYGKLLSGSMSRLGNRPRWSWDNWMHDPDRSGLVPFDLHIHDLDYIVATFGKPKDVVCDRARTDTQDYIHAVYHYDDFFIATEASWYHCVYPFTATFRFQFENAVMDFKSDALTIYKSDGTKQTLDGESGNSENDIALPKTNAYYNEIRYFVDCVLAGKDCDRVCPDELEEVLKLIDKLN